MQFFYAYVEVDDEYVPFDPEEHAVKDERVYGYEFVHNEGEFALLTLKIRNPRIGLLNPSRLQWLWFSSQDDDELEPTPRFFGRLVGLPEDLQQEILTIVYRAEPVDYVAQKEALAETLKVFPYWDQIFIDPDRRDDPDAVLEARPVRYHIDPVTHVVSVSHIITGEDGTLNIDVDAQYYPTLKFGYGEPPLSSVKVTAEVGWDQVANGSVNIKKYLLDAFRAAGSPGGQVTSFTGQGLEKSWPRPGDRIGGGWAFGLNNVGSPSIPGLDQSDGSNVGGRFEQGVTYWKGSAGVPNLPRFGFGEGEDDFVSVPVSQETGDEENVFEVRFYRWLFGLPHFNVAYTAGRKRTENLLFTLHASVQSILTEAEGEDTIVVRSDLISEPGEDGETPIKDQRKRSYFDTDRGKQSLSFLIALAVHRLLVRSRCINMSCEVPFATLVDASCRKSGLIIDERLPGGQAGGKITGYGFTLDGATGKLTCKVAIAGTIGRGEALPAPNSGTPTYVEEGYVQPGYQKYEGKEIIAIDDSVTYEDYEADLDDDGFNFFDMRPGSVIAGARAENTIRFTGLPAVDNTVTIGVKTYTWKAAAGAANTVKIGATGDECAFNLGAAILSIENLRGLNFGALTEAHEQVAPRLGEQPNHLVVVARTPGTAANAIATTRVGTGMAWQHATLVGGAPSPRGLRVLNGETTQRAVFARALEPDGFTAEFLPSYMDINEVITELNKYPTRVKLELVPVVGGPFNTDYEIEVGDLVIPKTVDLEAPSSP